ncbi:MAG: TIGR02147 family protein [Bdellovibrionales bacterium]|nr:TIGR02147 family protein [Oligoflexia bacterium]
MAIFDYEDYRTFLHVYLTQDVNTSAMKRREILKSAGISSSFLTQVLSESKQLSQEQAYEIALHIGLTEKETDYLLTLVDIGRAGSVKLKQRLSFTLAKLRSESQNIAANVNSSFQLTEEQKTIYYSNWIYSAIRNLIPVSQHVSVKEIAQKLSAHETRVETAIQTLIEFGLISRTESGFEYKAGYTHLDSHHPMIFRHHQNWRQKAIQRMDFYTDQHLHYTCPMAISKNAAIKIRAQLLDSIKALNSSIQDDPDVSFCLNIDFFEY